MQQSLKKQLRELEYDARINKVLDTLLSVPVIIQPVPLIEDFLEKAKEEIACCKFYGEYDEQKLTYLLANYMHLLALKDYGKGERK